MSVVDFKKRVLDRILRVAAERIRPALHAASQTLGNSLVEEILDVNAGTARLYTDYFWAVYVHDGRGSFFPRRGIYLCWFRNEADDPRLVGGHPVRASQVKTLRQVWSREEFLNAIKRNRRNAVLGLPPYMIFQRFHGGSPPHRFFEDATGIADEVRTFVAQEFTRLVAEELGATFGRVTVVPATLKISCRLT